MRVLGCSPAWPNAGGAQSAYLVDGGGRRLLLDCGPGALAHLRELDGDGWPHVDAVVISHLHHDHWGDLVAWVWGNLAGPGKGREQPEVWLPPGGRAQLGTFAAQLAVEGMFERSFRLHEYADGVEFDAGGFRVTPVAVPHWTSLSYALRVTNGSRTVVYSADCGPNEQLVELARGADLFVCEAAIASGAADWSPRTHMDADEAVAAFEAAGAKRLLLTHRPSELPAPAGREVAHDGLEIDL